MIRTCCVLLLTAAALGAQQTPLRGAPAQPTADQQLSALLMASDRQRTTGDVAGAVKGYEMALARVKADPSIRIREEEVLGRLSSGYIALKRYPDAVATGRRILAIHQEDCKPDAPFLARCADAQYVLGVALMYSEDFAGAVTVLTGSVANLRASGGKGDETMRMNELKNLGNAESMLGAAQFRAGDKEKAIATIRRAVADLKTVADNPKIDAATRGSARTSMQDAEASLKLLEPAPAKP